jgi:hypothetical protein
MSRIFSRKHQSKSAFSGCRLSEHHSDIPLCTVEILLTVSIVVQLAQGGTLN